VIVHFVMINKNTIIFDFLERVFSFVVYIYLDVFF
jgi:hypothetical protein